MYVCVCAWVDGQSIVKCEVVVLHEVVWPAFYKLRVNVHTHDGGDDQSAAARDGCHDS